MRVYQVTDGGESTTVIAESYEDAVETWRDELSMSPDEEPEQVTLIATDPIFSPGATP